MTDVVIVCDNTGRKLDELPVSIQREYPALDRTVDAGHGSFSIPANHPKATWRNLRYGNLVYVYSDQAGILEWAAVIWPSEPRGTSIKDGELIIQLRSSEWILANRATAAQDIFEDKAGRIFQGLLNVARRKGYLPISTDASGISLGGSVLKREYNLAPIYEAANQLATDVEAYWYFSPSIDTSNALTLKPFWKFKRTEKFRGALSTGGTSPNFSVTDIGEAAEIANHVVAYGRAESWAAPVMYEEENAASIGRYKQVYTKVLQCLDETTVDGLKPIVRAYLASHAFPPMYCDGIVLRAPFPRIGDVVDVLLTDFGGFITDQRGSTVKMQVQSATYSPGDNTLAIRLDEITV